MEDKYLNGIIIATIAILVGLAFWSTIGGVNSTLTQTQTSTNASFTLPTNGSTVELGLCGQLNTTNVVVFNESNGTFGFPKQLPAANFTISQGASSIDGYTITKLTLVGNSFQFYSGFPANVSCTYEPRGYIHEGGGRSVAALIPVFVAILIAFAAIPDLREWVGFLGKK